MANEIDIAIVPKKEYKSWIFIAWVFNKIEETKISYINQHILLDAPYLFVVTRQKKQLLSKFPIW